MTLITRIAIMLALSSLCGFGLVGQDTPQKGRRHSSLDGLYAVTIPTHVEIAGGGPLEATFTIGLGSGYSTYWKGPAVELESGHVDFNREAQRSPPAERKRLFREAVGRLRGLADGPDLVEKQLTINGLPATEITYKIGSVTFSYRLLATVKGIVRLRAVYGREEGKLIAMRFFDSLEAPSRAELIAEKIREATPEMLPRCDAKYSMATDIVEMALKGRVKSIVVTREELRDGKPRRSLREEITLDMRGRVLKKVIYEFDRPNMVQVFGCIDGRRVSKSGYASYENRFMTMGPARANAKPPDKRFTNAYEVELDQSGRIEQKRVYGNNAVLYTTSKYSYGDGTIEIVDMAEDGKVERRTLKTVDAKNRPVSLVDRHFGSRLTEWRNTYNFVLFDKIGNWRTRNGVYERFENGKLEDTSKFTKYRVLTYYD